MEIQEAFKLHTQGQHFKARIGDKTYDNVFITNLDVGSNTATTVTLMLPTPVGERDRLRRWRLDQVEVVV